MWRQKNMHMYFKFLLSFLHGLVYLCSDIRNTLKINFWRNTHHLDLFLLAENLHSSSPLGLWFSKSMKLTIDLCMPSRIVEPVQTTHCACGSHRMPTKVRSVCLQSIFWIRSVWPWAKSWTSDKKENGKGKPKEHFSVPLAEMCGMFSFNLQVRNSECQEKNLCSSINGSKNYPIFSE